MDLHFITIEIRFRSRHLQFGLADFRSSQTKCLIDCCLQGHYVVLICDFDRDEKWSGFSKLHYIMICCYDFMTLQIVTSQLWHHMETGVCRQYYSVNNPLIDSVSYSKHWSGYVRSTIVFILSHKNHVVIRALLIYRKTLMYLKLEDPMSIYF